MIWLVEEIGPNGSSWEFKPTRTEAEAHIAKRKAHWEPLVRLNNVPEREFRLYQGTEVAYG